jgi:glycine hydroxymethyltransferase
MVLWNDESLSGKINAGVFPGVQGSVMLHAVAGKAACLGEALQPAFKIYQQAALENARVLADALAAQGLRIVTGGTDTTLLLADLTPLGLSGDVAAKALERAGLAVNKNLIPFDPHPPEAPSGLRLSSNAGTARGFGVAEFEKIAGWIMQVLAAPDDAAGIERIHNDVRTLCAAWPIY